MSTTTGRPATRSSSAGQQLVRDQRVDQDDRVGRLEEHAADLLGPVGGALGLGVGLPARVRGGPVVHAGGDLPHATSFSISRSSVSSGSSQRPVWTGEVWMIVLDGATSQWKRSDWSSRATGPASASPGRDARHRVEVRAHLGGVEIGGEAGQARLVERRARGQVAARAAEEHHADVHALAALDPRDDAHDRVLERLRIRHAAAPRCSPRRACSASRRERARRRQPARRGSPHTRSRVGPARRARATTASRSASGAEPLSQAARRPRGSSPRSGSSTWSAIAGNGLRRVGLRAPSRGGGSRAPRRGRSATRGRARRAGSGCAACGRRSSPARRARRSPRPAPAPAGGPRPGCRAASRGGSRGPTLSPALPVISSWISGSGSAAPSAGIDLDQHDLRHRRARARAPARPRPPRRRAP